MQLGLFRMRRFLPQLCRLGMLCLLPAPLWARDERRGQAREYGWTGQVELDYDQSRSRTNALRTGFEMEWGNPSTWINLSGDLFTDPAGAASLTDDGYVTLELGYALYRNNDERLYVNAMLEVDPHSLLATRGWDLTPSVGVAWGLTEDWWIGGELGAVLATRPDDGNRTGYASLSLWITWLCGFTPSGTDSLSLGIWAASNEIPHDDNALFAEVEYRFDLTESLEATFALGTDPVSPWDHLGLYLTAGLTWSF
jgi:hypothetical protein